MEDRAVVADGGCFTHHHASRVVDEQARANVGGWVDVDAELLAALALYGERKLLPSAVPQDVRRSVALKSLVPLEVEQHVRQLVARGVAIFDSLEVDTREFSERSPLHAVAFAVGTCCG